MIWSLKHLNDGFTNSFLLHKTLIGGLLIIVMFLSAVWTRHPFSAEEPLVNKWCNAKFLQICSDKETNVSTYILNGLMVGTFSENSEILLWSPDEIWNHLSPWTTAHHVAFLLLCSSPRITVCTLCNPACLTARSVPCEICRGFSRALWVMLMKGPSAWEGHKLHPLSLSRNTRFYWRHGNQHITVPYRV